MYTYVYIYIYIHTCYTYVYGLHVYMCKKARRRVSKEQRWAQLLSRGLQTIVLLYLNNEIEIRNICKLSGLLFQRSNKSPQCFAGSLVFHRLFISTCLAFPGWAPRPQMKIMFSGGIKRATCVDMPPLRLQSSEQKFTMPREIEPARRSFRRRRSWMFTDWCLRAFHSNWDNSRPSDRRSSQGPTYERLAEYDWKPTSSRISGSKKPITGLN